VTDAREPTPHATGYEDAITRRIAGLETRIAALEADLARERTQSTGLAEDNAKLRGRTAEADAAVEGAHRVRALGWALVVVALLLAAWAAVLRFGVAH
jgi:hypothetical protein